MGPRRGWPPQPPPPLPPRFRAKFAPRNNAPRWPRGEAPYAQRQCRPHPQWRPPDRDRYYRRGEPPQPPRPPFERERDLHLAIDTVKKKLRERRPSEADGDLFALETPEARVADKKRIEHSKILSSPKGAALFQQAKKRDARVGSLPKSSFVFEKSQVLRKKIIHQLFKSGSDGIRKILNNPEQSAKYNFALASLIKERRNTLSKELRNVAEKSLKFHNIAPDSVRGEQIIRDAFLGHLGTMLDDNASIELSNMEPQVIAELSKVLQQDLMDNVDEDTSVMNLANVVGEYDSSDVKFEPDDVEPLPFESSFLKTENNESYSKLIRDFDIAHGKYKNEPITPSNDYINIQNFRIEDPKINYTYTPDRTFDYCDTPLSTELATVDEVKPNISSVESGYCNHKRKENDILPQKSVRESKSEHTPVEKTTRLELKNNIDIKQIENANVDKKENKTFKSQGSQYYDFGKANASTQVYASLIQSKTRGTQCWNSQNHVRNSSTQTDTVSNKIDRHSQTEFSYRDKNCNVASYNRELEEMRKIDDDIQVLLREKFRLYNVINSKLSSDTTVSIETKMSNDVKTSSNVKTSNDTKTPIETKLSNDVKTSSNTCKTSNDTKTPIETKISNDTKPSSNTSKTSNDTKTSSDIKTSIKMSNDTKPSSNTIMSDDTKPSSNTKTSNDTKPSLVQKREKLNKAKRSTPQMKKRPKIETSENETLTIKKFYSIDSDGKMMLHKNLHNVEISTSGCDKNYIDCGISQPNDVSEEVVVNNNDDDSVNENQHRKIKKKSLSARDKTDNNLRYNLRKCSVVLKKFDVSNTTALDDSCIDISEENLIENWDSKIFDDITMVEKLDQSITNDTKSISMTDHVDSIIAIKNVEKNILAASLDGNVYHYCITEGKLLNMLKCSELAVTCMWAQTESNLVYTGSLDSNLRCFNYKNGELILDAVNIGSPIQSMCHEWDTLFIGTRTGYVVQFDVKTNKKIEENSLPFSEQAILALEAIKEGPRKVLLIASRSQDVTVKDAETGLLLRTFHGPNTTVYSLLFDSSNVYCGTSGSEVQVFDFATGDLKNLHTGGKGAVCLQMYRGLLFAGCYDGVVYVFKPDNQQPIASIPGPGKMLLAMTIIDDKIIGGCKDKSLSIWKIPGDVLPHLN